MQLAGKASSLQLLGGSKSTGEIPFSFCWFYVICLFWVGQGQQVQLSGYRLRVSS